MSANSVTALQVADEDFLVASLIERCPKTMMLRELMMNALEAARHAPEDQRIRPQPVILRSATGRKVVKTLVNGQLTYRFCRGELSAQRYSRI